MPLNEMPSAAASKVASSTRVEIAEATAFHSSGDLLLATKTKFIYLAGNSDFKHCSVLSTITSLSDLLMQEMFRIWSEKGNHALEDL